MIYDMNINKKRKTLSEYRNLLRLINILEFHTDTDTCVCNTHMHYLYVICILC